jgi:hypothetical protein
MKRKHTRNNRRQGNTRGALKNWIFEIFGEVEFYAGLASAEEHDSICFQH